MDTALVKEKIKECLRQHQIEEDPLYISETPKLVRVKFSATQQVVVTSLVDSLREQTGHKVSVEMDPMKPPSACEFDVAICPQQQQQKQHHQTWSKPALAVFVLLAVGLVVTKKYFIHNLSDIMLLLR